MAVPTKERLDYFPLDCHMDNNVKLIQAEFGLKGFAVLVKLYQRIYGEHGYYSEWNDESLFLFMSENGLSGDSDRNLIDEIVKACIRRGIFSKDLFEKFGVLTSSGVQKRYIEAVNRRKNVCMRRELLLVPYGQKNEDVNISDENVYISSQNDDISEQKKVKEIKRKEIKENHSSSGRVLHDEERERRLKEAEEERERMFHVCSDTAGGRYEPGDTPHDRLMAMRQTRDAINREWRV